MVWSAGVMDRVSSVTYRVVGSPLSEGCVQYAEFGNVMIARTDGHETAADFRTIEAHLRALAGRTGGGVGLLYVVDHSLGPNPGFAENAKKVLDGTKSVLVGAATVLLPEGFVASLYRSVGMVVLRMVDRRGLVNVSGTVEDAAPWLVERLPYSTHTPSADGLGGAANLLVTTQRARRRLGPA